MGTEQLTLDRIKPNMTRPNIYGTQMPYPRIWQLMKCKLKEKDWFHPHPELEQYCNDNHQFNFTGEEYIVCKICRMKMGACID